jgi:hypothetical protein
VDWNFILVDQNVCFPGEGYNLVLSILSFIKFAAYQPRIESVQSSGELLVRYILCYLQKVNYII